MMLNKEFLRESLRFFGGPGYDREKRDLFVVEMKKGDSNKVLPFLKEFITDPDLDISTNALEAVLSINKELGFELTKSMFSHADSSIRYQMCGLMNEFGDYRAIEPLLEILRSDPDPQIRGMAAFGLDGIGDVKVIPDLAQTADNDHEFDRLGYNPSHSARDGISNILLRKVVTHATNNPNPNINQTYPAGGTLTGKFIYLSDPIDWDSLHQDLPKATHQYTSSWQMAATELHPFPFRVDVTYRQTNTEVKRIYIFIFSDSRWAAGIYLAPAQD